MGQNAKIDQIKFDRANANKGSERGRYMLEASMREFGFADAGTIDRNNTIIGGNKRTEVAGEIGMDDIVIIDIDGTKPVYIRRNDLDLNDPDDDRARRLAYMLNRSQQVSLEWDTEQLLADIGAGLDLSAMFRDDELNELLAELRAQDAEPVDAEPQIDRAEELREKWGVETGQLWLLDSGKGHPHRLICGDCTDADVVERLMGGERADYVFADPPYGVNKAEWDSTFPTEWISIAWGVSDRLMVTPGNTYLIDAAIAIGRYRDCVALYALNGMTKSVIAFGNFTPVLMCGDWKWAARKNVIEYSVELSEDIDHPSPKPLKAMVKLFDDYTTDGSSIMDPFAGSGTTGVACENLGRQALMVEISPQYCAVILERWATATGGTPQRVE